METKFDSIPHVNNAKYGDPVVHANQALTFAEELDKELFKTRKYLKTSKILDSLKDEIKTLYHSFYQ